MSGNVVTEVTVEGQIEDDNPNIMPEFVPGDYRVTSEAGWRGMYNSTVYTEKDYMYVHLDPEVMALMQRVHLDSPERAEAYLAAH